MIKKRLISIVRLRGISTDHWDTQVNIRREQGVKIPAAFLYSTWILSPEPALLFHINSISIEVLCSIRHSPCLWTRIILVRRLQSFSIWESNWDLKCVAVKRIMQEARELANDPSTDYSAAPLEEDIFVRTPQAPGSLCFISYPPICRRAETDWNSI